MRSGVSGALADHIFLLWTQPISSGSISNLLSAMYHSEFMSRNHEYWAWAHERGPSEETPALPGAEGTLDPSVVRTTGDRATALREADLQASREQAERSRTRPSLPLESLSGLGKSKVNKLKANNIKTVEQLAAISINAELALRLSDRSGNSGTLPLIYHPRPFSRQSTRTLASANVHSTHHMHAHMRLACRAHMHACIHTCISIAYMT